MSTALVHRMFSPFSHLTIIYNTAAGKWKNAVNHNKNHTLYTLYILNIYAYFLYGKFDNLFQQFNNIYISQYLPDNTF